jgi:hypothetical protein
MARCRPLAPKIVVNHGNVCECLLHLRKERSKLLDQWNWLKETQRGVHLGEKLKLPQQRHRDHGVGDFELR